jgi:carbon-monoxide dehydrogenase medium subunit
MSENGKRKYFRPTAYHKPTTLQNALELLNRHGTKAQIVAGATDVLVEQKPGIEVLIDITGLSLDYIEDREAGLSIGAAVTWASLENSAKLQNTCHKILSEAAHQMGTPQIRNVATIGGNLCSAVPSADCAPPLLALDAEIKATRVGGVRTIPVAEFFVDAKKTALKSGEILTEVCLPPQPKETRTIFLKMERGTVGDLALVNLALRITLKEDGLCQDARIALGAVAPTPIRAKKAEKMLIGKKPDGDLIQAVARAAADETRPISDVRASAAYRREISRLFVERALKSAMGLSAA